MYKMANFVLALLLLSVSCTSLRKRPTRVQAGKGEVESEHYALGKKIMITAQGKHSTAAGKKIHELGGNAVDVAVAVSFAISVERPQSTGIGGGGFLLLKIPGKKVPLTFDFREKAPLRSHSRMYLDKKGRVIKRKSIDGILAVGVPGLVAGLVKIHKKYGKLPLQKVMAPAISLAKKGFKVYPELAKALKYRRKVLKRFRSTRKIFTKKGRVLREGELLVQKDLSKTLRAIARRGTKGFYQGWVRKAILRESKRQGGLLSKKDFQKYNVRQRRPIHGTYKNHDIYSMAPPSSGGIHVIQILNTVEGLNLARLGVHHPTTVHMTASAMQQAFADRARYLGDTDFVRVPVKDLISKDYAKKIVESIPRKRAKSRNEVGPGSFPEFESTETTHLTVMDQEGYVVTSTQTINGYFGSGLVASGTGIILNNEMDDFAAKVGASNLFGAIGGENNLVKPGKRPLSSMSPTIITKDGSPVLALGSPSGTRILTCVAQTILNYIEHDLPLTDAISTVRYHHQWAPDEIRVGEKGLLKETEDALVAMGHKIRRKNLGCRVQAIAKEGDYLVGVSDIRGLGRAAGDEVAELKKKSKKTTGGNSQTDL